MRRIHTVYYSLAAGALLTGAVLVSAISSSAVPGLLKNMLQSVITVADDLPERDADVIYILGGSIASTRKHILTASKIYLEGKSRKILITNSDIRTDNARTCRPGDPSRNAFEIRCLTENGVNPSHIEKVSVQDGWFGTLAEARSLSSYCRKKNYSSIILVSSPNHSRRVTLSFGYFMKRYRIDMYHAGSSDLFLFREMVAEAVKLNIYRVLLVIDEMQTGLKTVFNPDFLNSE